MNLYHPNPYSILPLAHLPHHGEKFCTKERRIGFGPLGVITLYARQAWWFTGVSCYT